MTEPKQRIEAVLLSQRDAWNAGDLDGYMAGCWNSDQFTYVSSDGVTMGWNAMRDRFAAHYPDLAAMGSLSLIIRSIEILSDDAALVLGTMTVVSAAGQGSGNFTLIMRLIDGEWRVTHDHSSRLVE